MTNAIWEIWDDIHDDPEQQKRIESASKSACTPVLIDQTSCTGKFKGSSGNHSTALDSCSCIDFNRRRRPCKHMYRLAMELELLNVSFKSDTSAIVEPHAKRASLSDSVSIIEQLTVSQQKLLDVALGKMNSKQPTCCLPTSQDLQVLIDSGFLHPAQDVAISLSKYKKDELIALANSLDIIFPVTVKKKNEIIDFLLSNAMEQISNTPLLYTVVEYSPNIKHGKLHMYLSRKFQYCYSSDSNTFAPCSISPFMDYIPDDDVTALLYKLGYFK